MRRGRMDGISSPTLLVDIECFIPHPRGVFSLLYKILLYFRLHKLATLLLHPDKGMEQWLVSHERKYNVYLYTENNKEWKSQKIAAEEVGRSLTKYTRGTLLQQMSFKGVYAVVSIDPIPGDKGLPFKKL